MTSPGAEPRPQSLDPSAQSPKRLERQGAGAHGSAARIVLAEDAALVRAGLVTLLAEAGFAVVDAVASAPELMASVEREVPDAVVTDVRMPPGNSDDGLRAAIALRARFGVPVLVLSQYVAGGYLNDLLADGAGGVGYLLKEKVADVDQLAGAIRTVIGGGTVIDPEVVQVLVSRRPLDRLTTREREVLALLAQGRSNAQIGGELFLSEAAVTKHIGSILAKLDLPPEAAGHRRVLAVLEWLRAGGG